MSMEFKEFKTNAFEFENNRSWSYVLNYLQLLELLELLELLRFLNLRTVRRFLR